MKPDTAPMIYFTRGLPGSGKSTWARRVQSEYVGGTIKIVSMDDLRRMIDGGKAFTERLTRKDEDAIQRIQAEIVAEAISLGSDVIVHNTHAVNKVPNHVMALARDRYRKPFGGTVVDFTTVEVSTCIDRDHGRKITAPSEHVGLAVISRIQDNMRKGEDGFRDWSVVSPEVAEGILRRRHEGQVIAV